MNDFASLIKWPGGKTREIKYINHLIPKFDRYIEPFVGGGAMFFHLRPHNAVINDISNDLMNFYTLAKNQDEEFYNFLSSYNHLFESILVVSNEYFPDLLDLYQKLKDNLIAKDALNTHIEILIKQINASLDKNAMSGLILDDAAFEKQLIANVLNKISRTVTNEKKSTFSLADLKENLITGFTSGIYMYFRDVYNDINLNRENNINKAYQAANFYFIREYCYGSMFRYNRKGEFNIPYGGMSYNRKNFHLKINNIFSETTESIFKNTDIYSLDFEELFELLELNENDFMFLDPPYDTNFSDYEGETFTHDDQRRLAEALKKTQAQFILIIKNTDFIHSLYADEFKIMYFNNTYLYNMRSRNNRDVEHLIITNIPE